MKNVGKESIPRIRLNALLVLGGVVLVSRAEILCYADTVSEAFISSGSLVCDAWGTDSGGLDSVIVRPDEVLREGADRVVGINLNYIRDHDANRPQGSRTLDEAIDKLGAQWLRFPGGEKSDWHLWAEPPFETPNPVGVGWYATPKGVRMDFDHYMKRVRKAGAEPFVVVAYDSEERTGLTREEYLEAAVAWVRYANEIMGYGVRYWEIGNENWHHGTSTGGDMVEIVAEFSQAMKDIDPEIQIGASGNQDQWWKEFLPEAAPYLDFVSLSLYNAWEWGGYDFYSDNPDTNLIREVEVAIDAIGALPEPHRDRIRVVVTETNSKDFSDGGWSDENSIGHAVVTFDTLGRLIRTPSVTAAMLWNTRWMDDDEAEESLWYALGPLNQIKPSGLAVAIWGKFALEKMVFCDSGTEMVEGFACHDPRTGSLNVFLVNKGVAPISEGLNVIVESNVEFTLRDTYLLKGRSPDDVDPVWGAHPNLTTGGNGLWNLVLPPHSVTILLLESKESGTR